MTENFKNELIVKKEKFNLEDKDKALVLAIQELTRQIQRLNHG